MPIKPAALVVESNWRSGPINLATPALSSHDAGNLGGNGMTEEFGTPVPPWDKEDEPPAPPHIPTTPFAAIIGGMILLFALGFFMPNMARFPTDLGSVETLTIAVTIVLWLVGFVLIFRRATTGWIAGSFFLILLAAMLGTNAGVTRAKRERQADNLAFASIERRPDGSFGLPDGVEPGPMTRDALAHANQVVAIARDSEDKIAALGIHRLTNADEVTRDPELLRDCDRFPRAKAIVDDAAIKLTATHAKFRIPIPGNGLDDGERLAFQTQEAARDARVAAKLKAQTANYHDLLNISGEMCRILATTQWQDVDGAYRFTNRADMLRFDDYQSRRADLEAWAEQSIQASMQQIEDTKRRMRDDIPE